LGARVVKDGRAMPVSGLRSGLMNAAEAI